MQPVIHALERIPTFYKIQQMKRRKWAVISFLFLLIPISSYSGFTRDIEFPVDGISHFSDTFSDQRPGHQHEGVDIFADKMTPIASATDGKVSFLVIPEASWGYAIFIKDSDGYEYRYLHINNDTPGTDDGNGGIVNAYAPGITRGVSVTRGQHIAWVGDSGNAETTASHLHFEIHTPGDSTAISPYESLLAATKKGAFNPETAATASPTINADKEIPITINPVFCIMGSLIKSPSSSAVYYCGADGKRYVFPNDKVYFSWYDDFSEVITITHAELARIKIGGNVTYKPGNVMVKIQTDPKVYAVEHGGILRWLTEPTIAESLYGGEWKESIHDVSDAFFINYIIGDPITSL